MTTYHSSGGVGFGGLLAVAFIVLKLTGHITWSWFWVLSPIWIPFGIFLVCVLGILIGWLTFDVVPNLINRGRRIK